MNNLEFLKHYAKANGALLLEGTPEAKRVEPLAFHFKIEAPFEDWEYQLIKETIDVIKEQTLPTNKIYLHRKGFKLING